MKFLITMFSKKKSYVKYLESQDLQLFIFLWMFGISWGKYFVEPEALQEWDISQTQLYWPVKSLTPHIMAHKDTDWSIASANAV